jgi:HEPN domain-containing protein
MSGRELDLVGDWLRRAHSDLNLGRAALKTKGVLPEAACFHAQQCAEKALKALLLKLGVDFPRTHAIEVLLDLLKEQEIEIPSEVDRAFELSQYAVQTRYPGGWEPVTKKEAAHALERATLVIAWVENRLA